MFSFISPNRHSYWANFIWWNFNYWPDDRILWSQIALISKIISKIIKIMTVVYAHILPPKGELGGHERSFSAFALIASIYSLSRFIMRRMRKEITIPADNRGIFNIPLFGSMKYHPTRTALWRAVTVWSRLQNNWFCCIQRLRYSVLTCPPLR